MGFGVSIGVAMAYLIIFAISVGLGYMGKFTAYMAAWAANVLCFWCRALYFFGGH